MNKKGELLIISELYPYPPHKSGVCSTIFNFLMTSVVSNYEVTVLHFETKYCDENSIIGIDASVKSQMIKGREYVSKLNSRKLLKPKGMIHLDSRKMKEVDVSKYEFVIFASITVTCLYDKLINKNNCKMILFEADSPVMFYERELQLVRNPLRRLYNRTQMFLISNYEKKLVKIMDKIVFVSDVDRKYVSKYIGDSKTFTAKIGVNYIDLKKNHRTGKVMKIGFSGKMDYKPNYLAASYIINEIMPLLDGLDVHYEMNLIGSNPPDEWISIAQKNRKLKISGYVEDIQKAIADLDIYISPLFIGTGMKNKVLEALSIGVPLIASAVSVEGIDGMKNSVNFIYCDDNASSWTNAIIELCSNVNKRIYLSENGKKLIRTKYSWENFAEELLYVE